MTSLAFPKVSLGRPFDPCLSGMDMAFVHNFEVLCLVLNLTIRPFSVGRFYSMHRWTVSVALIPTSCLVGAGRTVGLSRLFFQLVPVMDARRTTSLMPRLFKPQQFDAKMAEEPGCGG